MRKIKLAFVQEQVTAEAELLDQRAPQTTNCIWHLLEEPFEGYAVHAMWTGRELSLPIPSSKFLKNEGLHVPPENQTVFPLPGDLVWNAYLPYQWQGNPSPVYDFGIFYGRDSRILLPIGWRPSNHFGIITENLSKFAEICGCCQTEGRKLIRLERII